MLKQILTNPTFISIVSGQLRHLATAAGAALATYGFIDASEVASFSGAVVVIATMALSAASKKLAA